MTTNQMNELKEKINVYYRLKQEVAIIEKELKPLNLELKAVAKSFPMEANGDWVIESDDVKICVSDTVKVTEEAVNFLARLGRPEMISSKPYVKKEDLFNVVGKDEAYGLSLIEYISVLRPTLKNKEQLFKEVLTPSTYTQNQKVIQMRSSVAKQRRINL